MDEAIRNGQESGVIFKTKERYECVIVEGDLVKIKK